MTATDQLDGDRPRTPWRATLAVRIPRDGSGELVAEATARLEATHGIDTATVDALAGLEPALAATIARLEVSLETTAGNEQAVREALEDVAGLQRVEQLEVPEDSRQY